MNNVRDNFALQCLIWSFLSRLVWQSLNGLHNNRVIIMNRLN